MDKNLLITQIAIMVAVLGFWFFTHLENKNQLEKAKVELEILKLKEVRIEKGNP